MVYTKTLSTDINTPSFDLAQKLIANSWENNKLASGYLFFGPAGTGKLSLARNLAKALNCKQNCFPPCLTCSSCVKIDNNNHPDVHYIQKQDSNFLKIEQIHQMQKEIFLHPFEGEYKVFIMCGVEDLTPEASNSLLKILEEPPGHSLIILIASDLRRIFSTIISRCQKVRFNSLGRQEAEKALSDKYNLDAGSSHFLAFMLEGRLGEALKFKSRDILSEKNEIIRNFILRPVAASEKFNAKDKEKLAWILKVLIGCIRDIYMLKVGVGEQELINADICKELLILRERFSFRDLDLMLNRLSEGLENIRQNINPSLLFDNLQLLWRK